MLIQDPGLSPERLRKLPLANLVQILDERYGELRAQLDELPRLGDSEPNIALAIWEVQTALQILRERIKSGEEVKKDAN